MPQDRSLRRTRPDALGFTLVELLVVIGIIALLISILMPALRKAREQANGVACSSNQRQLMQAFLMFAAEHQGRLPGNFTDYQNPDTDKRAWLLNFQEPLSGTDSNGQFDYASFAVFAGARITNIKSQSKHVFIDGRTEWLPTPIICEEDARALNRDNIEGFHNGSDRIANTHPTSTWQTVTGGEKVAMGGGYYASIDGSVHYFREPKGSRGAVDWSQRGPRGREVNFGETGFAINWGWWDFQ